VRIKKLIKTFDFIEEHRAQITLGPGARLNPVSGGLELAEPYSDAANIYAATWVSNPTSAQQWLGFEVIAHHPTDALGVELTSLGFRLSNGIAQYFWNGSTWVLSVADWNTEAEIALHIASFSSAQRKIQVIVNLVTTNAMYTPKVAAIKILYASTIEFQEDLIWRSLIPALREQIRPIGDWPIKLTTAGATIDLSAYKLDTPYNVKDIDSVFNHTDDPEHLVNLLSSYNPNTQTITLISTLAQGKDVWVRFLWEPEVAVTTSQEYDELAKVPALVLNNIRLVDQSLVGANDSVTNKINGQSTKVLGPSTYNIDMYLTTITSSAKDQTRLADELKRFFANSPMLRSKGLDELYRLWLLEPYSQGDEPQQTGIQSGKLRFRIVQALFFERNAVESYPVTRLHLVGDMNAVTTN
jgi:hypothetical protein